MASVDGYDTIERAVASMVPDPLATVRSNEIGPLFGATTWWFSRGSVRKRLASAGFPRPIRHGVYLKRDVVRFIVCRSHGVDPRERASPRRPTRGTLPRTMEEVMAREIKPPRGRDDGRGRRRRRR